MRSKLRQSLAALPVMMIAACSPEPTKVDDRLATRTGNNSSPSFEVIEWEDISHARAKRATVRVRMNPSKLPSLDEVRQVSHLVKREQADRWDEITVFVYLPGMDAKGAAYGIARFPSKGQDTCTTHDDALILTDWYAQTPTAKQHARDEKKFQEQHEQRVKTGTAADYNMSLTLRPEGSARLQVECVTNLPDDTVISIVVGREYGMRGVDASDEPYAQYYFDDELAVSDGRVSATVELDDRVWQEAVDKKVKRMRSLTLDMHVDTISNDIFARALYTSHNRGHPPHVVQVLGANGQYVGGPLSRRAGNGRAMSVKQYSPHQFSK